MLARHRVLSIVMLSSFAALAGCGGSSEVIADEGDTGTVDETGDDTGATPEDTGATPDDTGATGDGGPLGDTDVTTDSGAAVDSAVTADTGTAVDSAVTADTGTADTGTAADTAPIDAGPTATCASAAVATYTDKHVRQGAGAITITVTGTSLATVTGGTIGAITCTAAGATATSVTLTCTVPHGAALGTQNLVLTGVTATCTGAVIIDKITSAVATGDDTTGLGTATKPFKSVKKSLSVADAGDTVFLTTGTYGTASGDTWTTAGTTNALSLSKNVLAGVTIEGDPAGAPSLVGTDATAALRLTGNTTIKNVKFDGFRWAIVADAGTVTLTDVVVANSTREGVFIEGATLAASAAAAGAGTTASKCLFTGNQTGLHLYGNSKATLTNCDITLSKWTAADVRSTAGGSPDFTAATSRLLNNGSATAAGGLNVYGGTFKPGVYVEGGAKFTTTGGELSGSFDYGFLAQASTTAAPTISFTNTDFLSNGNGAGSAANSAIRIDTPAAVPSFGSLKMSGGKVDKSGYFGISTGGAFNTDLTNVTVTASGNSGLFLAGTGVHVLSGVTATGNAQNGLAFGGSGSLSAKGLVATGNGAMTNAAQINVTDGATAATKIEFLAGATPTTTSRGTASATVPLVRDGRPSVAGGGTTITFATGSLFQGSTLTANTYTALTGSTPLNVIVPGGTQLALQIANAGRKIQVL